MGRLSALFHRRRIERDLEDEIAFHLAMQAEANRAAGMPEREAQFAARRQFGGISQVKDGCRDQILGSLGAFIRDQRLAWRGLRRSPRFSALVILTLAFGIGTNVTVFSMVNAVLLDALPFEDPGRLVLIAKAFSVPLAEDYNEQCASFSGVAPWVDESMSLVVSGTPERVRGARASARFLPVLGVKPLLGRWFRPDEDRPGGARVAVLSHGAWRNRFGADPSILGKPIRVNAENLTVVGVLPVSFRFPGEPVELWVPRVFENRFVSPQMVRNGAGILTGVIARLRPGVSFEQADAELRVFNTAAGPDVPHTYVEPLAKAESADFRPSLLLLWGAAGCILLVTCANTAGLLLSRAAGRRKEIAVRLALGISRGRLAVQLLGESVPLTALGGLLGFVLGRAGLAAVSALGRHDLVGWREVEMGLPAFAFTAGVSVVAAAVFGLAPALSAIRSNPQEGLRDSARCDSAGSSGRVRSALVIVETAVAVALVMSAGLLLRNYARMRTPVAGIRSEGLFTASLRLPDARYGTGRERVRFYDELLRRVRTIPGVAGAGATSALQLRSTGEGSMTWPEGAAIETSRPPIIRNRSISLEYLQTLGIPLVAGRGFSETDTEGAPKVMLVNESFARKFFPGSRAIGRLVTYSSEHVTCRIVGVVTDVRPRMTDFAAQPEMYFPYQQRSRHEMTLVLRAAVAPAVLEKELRTAVAALDPEQPVYDLNTLEEVISDVLSRPRSTAAIVGFFSVAALAMAVVGIYGVLSFTVAERKREIGIRMALGAQAREIRGLVLRQSLKLIFAGIAIGLPASLAIGRLSSALLFGATGQDPADVAAVVMVVVLAGLTAASVPAHRAMQVDPVEALK